MALRRRRVGELDRRILGINVSRARENMIQEVTHAREKYGLEEARELALERADKEPENALGILQEVREVTGEAILMFERRGFKVRDIGEHFEKALGDRQFRDAERAMPDETPRELVNTVFEVVGETWVRLQDTLVSQAEENARRKVEEPQTKESIEERVAYEMRAVWAKKAEDVRFGSRIEDFRAGVGLRTLSALVQRYRSMDARGRDDAMPCAYAWADRGYWLTKYGIKELGQRYPAQENALNTLGAGFEETLGESSLARGGLETPPDTRGWEIIAPAKDKINETWRKIKETLPKT